MDSVCEKKNCSNTAVPLEINSGSKIGEMIMKKQGKALSLMLGAALVVSTALSTGVFAASASVKSDTTQPFALSGGKSYTFRLTVSGTGSAPKFTVGNRNLLKTRLKQKSGGNYYYQITAANTSGSTGVYTSLPGQKAQRLCVVTVSKKSSSTSTQTTPEKATETIDVYAGTGDTPITDYPFYDKNLTTISFSQLKTFAGNESVNYLLPFQTVDMKSANYVLQFFQTDRNSVSNASVTGPWATKTVQIGNTSVMKLVKQVNYPMSAFLFFQVMEKGSTSVTVQGEDGRTKTVTVNIT